MIKSIQKKNQLQAEVSYSKKHPDVFKLKTASLVVLVLIAIIAILDICLLVKFQSNRQPSTNISFVNNLIQKTANIQTGTQIQNLIKNLVQGNPNFYFQYAEVLTGLQSNFDVAVIRNKVFSKKSSNILFIFTVNGQQGQNNKIGFFSSASFGLPEEEDYNSSLTYKTFQSQEKTSTIFSLSKFDYLIMNQRQNIKNPLECRTYQFNEEVGYFAFLNTFKVDLKNGTITYEDQVNFPSVKCFKQGESIDNFKKKVNSIFGFDLGELGGAKIQDFQIYHLYNE